MAFSTLLYFFVSVRPLIPVRVRPSALLSLGRRDVTAAMLVYPTNPPEIELYYHANIFFCFGGKTKLLITLVSEISPGIKEKKTFLWNVLINSEAHQHAKGEKCFCDEPASVRPPGITQHRILGLSPFFCWNFVLPNFSSLKNLIKQFALVGYQTGYNHLGATRLVGYLPSHIQRALVE